MKIILASASPRRKELLTGVGFRFMAVPADVDESFDEKLPPGETVMRLAALKASTVQQKHPRSLIIGADTVVVIDGRILGKPRDAAQAREMLAAMSGRIHEVYSGVALMTKEFQDIFFVKTDVRFYTLDKRMIEDYVATGEPLDKAGAYGIQRYGSLLVESIKGDYFNVVGLPVAEVCRRLYKNFDICPKWEKK